MRHELVTSELDVQTAELLPERRALGLFNVNVANIYATNTSLAANVASVFAVAASSATQTIVVWQAG